MAQSKTAKIMAILALAAISLSIVWTWILFFMGSNSTKKQTITKEELQKMIDKSEIKVTWSWADK